MTKRTLFIHIGTHRTATTSTQEFLALNFRNLKQRGFLQVNGVPRQVYMMERLFSGELRAEQVAKRITRQADEAKFPIQAAILTDEDICIQRDLTHLAELKEYFDVKIVFVMRRQDLWLESWYLQNIKWQWQPHLCHLSFEEFLAAADEFHWMDYHSVLTRFAEAFGPEAIVPMVFERDQMPGGPIRAFCDNLGIPEFDTLEQPQLRTNSSPSPMMGELMRQLPLDEVPEAYRHYLEGAFLDADRDRTAQLGPQSSLYMSRPQRDAFLARFEAGNAEIAQRYFGRDALFQDPLPAADAPLAQRTLPGDPDQTLQDYVSPVLRYLMGTVIELAKQAPAK